MLCSKCKIEKDDDDFNKNKIWCKCCIKEYNKQYRKNNKKQIKEYKKQYYKDNKEQIKKSKRQYYENNKEQIKEYDKQHYDNNKEQIKKSKRQYYENNKEQIREHNKQYCKDNKEKINERINKRRLIDPKFKLRSLIGRSINLYFKRHNGFKQERSLSKYINIQELYNYIESKFEHWMNWDNHGKYNPETWDDNDQSTWTWQLDHIIPHSQFNYTSMDDEAFKKCWAFENLRPYSAKQNIIDGNRR